MVILHKEILNLAKPTAPSCICNAANVALLSRRQHTLKYDTTVAYVNASLILPTRHTFLLRVTFTASFVRRSHIRRSIAYQTSHSWQCAALPCSHRGGGSALSLVSLSPRLRHTAHLSICLSLAPLSSRVQRDIAT
jgi:hypothetical protein